MSPVTYDPTPLIAGDYPLKSEPVVVASGQTLAEGAVIGKVTATQKYVLSLAGAVDGSEVPRGVLAVAVDAAAGDVTGPAYFSGAFAEEKMVFGTGHTAATVRTAWRDASAPLFIETLGTAA